MSLVNTWPVQLENLRPTSSAHMADVHDLVRWVVDGQGVMHDLSRIHLGRALTGFDTLHAPFIHPGGATLEQAALW